MLETAPDNIPRRCSQLSRHKGRGPKPYKDFDHDHRERIPVQGALAPCTGLACIINVCSLLLQSKGVWTALRWPCLQALLDVYTIQREVGRLDNLRVGLVGDLANGRTARSLAYLLSMYNGIKFYFVAPNVVRMQVLNHRALHACDCSLQYCAALFSTYPERPCCMLRQVALQ